MILRATSKMIKLTIISAVLGREDIYYYYPLYNQPNQLVAKLFCLLALCKASPAWQAVVLLPRAYLIIIKQPLNGHEQQFHPNQ